MRFLILHLLCSLGLCDLNREILDTVKRLADKVEELQTTLEKTQHQCSSKTLISDVQNLLNIDECAAGSHNCNQHVGLFCEDLTIGFRCTCSHRFEFNGTSCVGIDVCKTGDHDCHPDAKCVSRDGSHSCICPVGYSGDGLYCEAIPCEYPMVSVEGLGCLEFVHYYLPVEEARQNCQGKNARLLEGISTRKQLDELMQHFEGRTVNIGITDRRWTESGIAIEDSSSIWKRGYPEKEPEYTCGGLALYDPKNYGIYDQKCDIGINSICQQ